ncbi:hypothetical protein PR048_025675 [Dryococelus australis]|uniref:Uncharacterized protein n=1 Tax=Dryococelus australis TaxID=614101 RepID=A0ABQ9GJ96_9NEOP|nr:hypothetical protein PR048_025675 [Dryococelus australis]
MLETVCEENPKLKERISRRSKVHERQARKHWHPSSNGETVLHFSSICNGVLGITYSLSQQLQSKDIDLMAAGCLIKSTKEELARIRSSEKYDELEEKVKTLANYSNIE